MKDISMIKVTKIIRNDNYQLFTPDDIFHSHGENRLEV